MRVVNLAEFPQIEQIPTIVFIYPISMETTHVTYVEIVEHSYLYIHTDRQTKTAMLKEKVITIKKMCLSLVYISLKRIYFI